MSATASDGEGSVGHEADFVDATADMEVDMEVDWRPDLPCEHVGTTSGAADQESVDLGQEEQRRFEPPYGAKSKWPQHGLPLPIITEPHSVVPGATAHSVGPGAG